MVRFGESYMKAHFEAVIICSSPIIAQPALKWFGIFILLIWLDNWVLSMQLNGQFLGKVSYVQRLSIEYLVAPLLALLAHPWKRYKMLLNVGSGVRVHRSNNWVLSIYLPLPCPYRPSTNPSTGIKCYWREGSGVKVHRSNNWVLSI